ncbi:hypothetical protein M2165_000370 [Variovorax sp. TBS-050B]|uniref:hypothetical protein n=1 Tax=Variovorax sp. TBS-050B TaxID=2940551 RepID=UPI0024744722|nr:hypothetical protein [Variovorax sp. TBS-050B]MDH6590481.1 hypothetical protein [Variovorax sp. TBS-050B]
MTFAEREAHRPNPKMAAPAVACAPGRKTASRAKKWSSGFGVVMWAACCLSPASAQEPWSSPSEPAKAVARQEKQSMRTEAEKRAASEAFQAELKANQAIYDSFRYTDAQREQVIELIAKAMKVIRGEASFDSLTQRMPVIYVGKGQQPNPSTLHLLNAKFLNEWTSIYVNTIPRRDGKPGFEPAHFQIEFKPEIDMQRERLENLLELKVVHGWRSEGGNLQYEFPQLHGRRPFNGGVFHYSPLKQPQDDFEIEVVFTFLNGPDKNPYKATQLSDIAISRNYLTPEQIKQRDDKKLGHLPRCRRSAAPALMTRANGSDQCI